MSGSIAIEVILTGAAHPQAEIRQAASTSPTRTFQGTSVEDTATSITVNTYEDTSEHRPQPGTTTIIFPASDTHSQNHLDRLLSAPITEFVFLRYKLDGSPLDTVKPLIEHQQTLPNVQGAIWGSDVSSANKDATGSETEERAVALIGWSSVQDHTETVSTPDFQAYIAKCGSATQSITMYHVPLQPVRK